MSSSHKRVQSETDPLLDTFAEAIDSSEHPRSPEIVTPIGSISVAIGINFLSGLAYSIVLPSLPLFFLRMRAEAHLSGWAIAAYTLGTFISVPLLGLWSKRRGPKEVLLMTLLLLVGANIWYGLSHDIYQAIPARFLVGAAVANRAVANSYISTVATMSNIPPRLMMLNAAVGLLGDIAGPVLAALSSSIPGIWFEASVFVADSGTYPAYISAILALIAFAAVIPMKDISHDQGGSHRSKHSHAKSSSRQGSFSKFGVLIVLTSAFLFTAAVSVFETAIPIYTLLNPHLNFDALFNSFVFGGVAISALLSHGASYLVMRFFKVPDRIIMIFFGLLVSAGFFVLVNWDIQFIGLTQFTIGVLVYSFGISVVQTMLVSVFVQMVDGLEHSVMLGWLSTASSVARIVSPLAVVFLWYPVGPNFIFIVVGALSLLPSISMILFYKRIEPRDEEPVQSINY